MSDDRRLLREYVQTGSRKAPEELIQRYLGLVYSAALRQARDPNLAEDVTQAVFLVLTQKARTIRNGVAIGGWLLSVTRCVVVTVMRKQAVKKKHEQRAARPEVQVATAQEWEEIAPLLDAELNRLGHVDRDAVVLRFFQDRSFAEIGAELGFSEEAARKRVGRALERLRARLDGRGMSVTSGALSLAIGAYALQGAPSHLLAGTIAASVGSATPYCVGLAKGAINMIAWAKTKLAGAVATSLLMGGTGAVLVTYSIEQPAIAVAATPPAAPAPATQKTAAQPPALAAPPAPAGPNGHRGNEINSSDRH